MNAEQVLKLSDNQYQCKQCDKIFAKKGIGTHVWAMHGDGKG